MADKTVVVRAVYRSNVAQGMRQDAGAITGLSASVESSAAKSANATKALGAAGAVAGKLLLLGVGGALAVGAKAAIDFESSMAGVAKTTDLAGNSFDRNSGPLYAFGQALRQMSLRVPINVNELAKIAELGGQLGIETPNLVEFTEVMAELGVATNLTTEEAATGFARFANIMRTPQEEFRKLGSIVVELGNNFATTESEILAFATRIAPVGLTVGATEAEVFGLSAALSSLGIPAERGGTAVQKWMISAKQAVDQGGESLEKFAKVAGMTSDEFADLFAESPAAAFAEFARGLDGITKSGGDVFATLDGLSMSEVRLTQVLLAAAGGYEVVASAIDTANREAEEADALAEEAARRFGTTASQIQLVGNAFNDLRIEIGNAVLGSGGLAFALDVLREFFGIIKDNLGVIQGLVAVLGLLAVLKIASFFAGAAAKATEFIGGFQKATAAAQGLSGATRVAQLSMLAFSTVANLALGVVGLLATAWALMAVNAAQAKAEFRALNQEIEDGAQPLDVFTGKLLETLSEKQLKALNDMGFSARDLAEHLMNGSPAASELGKALSQDPASFMGGVDEDVQGLIADLIHAQDAAKAGEKIVGGFFEQKRNSLRDAAIESGKALGVTNKELETFAERAIRAFGYNITNDQFVAYLENLPVLMDEAGNRAGQMSLHMTDAFGSIRDEMSTADVTWKDFLDPETAEGTIDKFTEDNLAAVADFREGMTEEFEKIGEAIRSGMPMWDEYHKAVLGSEDGPLSYKGALAAQRAFLEDTRDFVEQMPTIMDMGASVDTIDWLDSLDAPIRGAIGRLNDSQLEELIAGANANFDALNRLHNERWLQIYPENANLAFAAMVGELTSRVDEMNLPGEYASEAFFDGLMEMADTMPEKHRDDFMAFIQELMATGAIPYNEGFDQSQQWIRGMAAGYAKMAEMIKPIIKAESDEVKNYTNEIWGVRSPSKWWENIGTQMTLGLAEGVKGMSGIFSDFTPDKFMPSMSPGLGGMSSITNNRSTSYALTVNGGGNGSNLNAEAQTLLTLLTIVGGVEGGAGR